MTDTDRKLEDHGNEPAGQLEAAGVGSIDAGRLARPVDSLESVIENRDALYVAGADASERETVRRNLVVEKLGVDARARGERAVAEFAERMAGSRRKHRAALHHLLEEALG